MLYYGETKPNLAFSQRNTSMKNNNYINQCFLVVLLVSSSFQRRATPVQLTQEELPRQRMTCAKEKLHTCQSLPSSYKALTSVSFFFFCFGVALSLMFPFTSTASSVCPFTWSAGRLSFFFFFFGAGGSQSGSSSSVASSSCFFFFSFLPSLILF